MSNKIVVFGTGEIAEVADFYFSHDSNFDVVAFVVDGAYLHSERFLKRPVVALEDVQQHFPPNSHKSFVAVSYRSMNRLRQEKVEAFHQSGYELVSYISSKATIWPDLANLRNVFILEDNTIQPFARIGHNVFLWSGNHIGHHSAIEDNVFVSSHVVISGGALIGANSFLGVNATIRNQVALAPFTLVGMGTVIEADTVECGVYKAREKVKPSRVKSTDLKSI